MERDTNGLPVLTDAVEAQRHTDTERRVMRRASVQRLAATHRHPLALADALETRTEALRLTTLDEMQRTVAREGYYADAEMLADAWLTLDAAEYHGAFKPEPEPAPMHTCQTRAEWAAVWDDAVEAGSWLTRQWYARQERAALVSERANDAAHELMGASLHYDRATFDVAGLTVRDLTHIYRAHRIKARQQVDAEAGEDVRAGYWRTYDREQRPLVWRNGKVAAGADGRASERAAIKAAARAVALAAQRARQRKLNARDGHTISADLTAMLQRASAGTSER